MKTIAIIDDDLHIGDMIEEVLRREGYGVIRAYSGTEALYLLSEKRPDLILLDLMMPGLMSAAPSYELGRLRLDTMSHDVTYDDKHIRLTKTEYAILKFLMQNSGQVIAKSVILDRISEDTPDCTESSLKIHVSNLRKKLRDASGREYIEAVWGIGFKISEE